MCVYLVSYVYLVSCVYLVTRETICRFSSRLVRRLASVYVVDMLTGDLAWVCVCV